MTTSILTAKATTVDSRKATKAKPFFHLLTAYGTAGIGLGFVAMLLLVFHAEGGAIMVLSPPVIFTLFAFLSAAILYYTTWRWTPTLGILLALVQVIFNFDRILNVLAASGGLADFYITPVMLLLVLITLFAGVVALFQNYSQRPYSSQAPRWVVQGLFTLAGVVLGIYFLGSILPNQNEPMAGAMVKNIPTLTFDNPDEEIMVQAGKPVLLKIVNPTPFSGGLHIDGLNVHTVVKRGESYIYFYPEKAGRYKFLGTMGFYRKQTPKLGQRTMDGSRIEGFIVAM